MSLVSGCQAPQMYHSLPRDFYHHHHQPPPPPSAVPPSQPSHQQHQQQQQRYLPSMETLSAAAAAAASSLHGSSAMNPSPPSSSDNSSIAYFQNLMFNSQYPSSAGPADYAALSSSGGGTDQLTLCGPDVVVYPHSTPANLYMNYDDLPLLLPSGNGVDDGTGVPRVRTVKRRVSSNRKERRRTHSINTAFAALRGCIPNVPSDTKLSKIKTLRLATSYIAYLMDILNKDDPKLAEGGFKADISRKIESREEKRKRESEEILKAISAHGEEKPSRGRTGWPQQVWAAELKQ